LRIFVNIINAQDKEKELEIFYDRFIAQDLEYFKISPDFARGLHAFYERLNRLDLSGVEFITGKADDQPGLRFRRSGSAESRRNFEPA